MYVSGEPISRSFEQCGGLPFIAFKSNSNNSNKGGVFERAFNYFSFKKDEYLYYHLRSNIEAP